MPRGITSATVVPTASDDYAEPAQAPPTNASISDEEGGVYSSEEEEDSHIPATPVADLQSDKYLQAAFNGEASEAQVTSADGVVDGSPSQAAVASTGTEDPHSSSQTPMPASRRLSRL